MVQTLAEPSKMPELDEAVARVVLNRKGAWSAGGPPQADPPQGKPQAEQGQGQGQGEDSGPAGGRKGIITGF